MCGKDYDALPDAEKNNYVRIAAWNMLVPGSSGAAGDWWSSTLQVLQQRRPRQTVSGTASRRVMEALSREHADLTKIGQDEAVPRSVAGFRHHPKFVLKRFIGSNQVLREITQLPSMDADAAGNAVAESARSASSNEPEVLLKEPEPVGYHRGEPYYLRSVVHTVYSEQSWFRKFARVRCWAVVLPSCV